eukprot:CAMPEP_0118674090 /NCGR_PEP_ID=MMETSP0800-20121206/693_1 /TAXON_ID=210618 ORGANISM="Striatella unipunctata, Strain CCMP2910" /NCGR_SAMPLE_ID=MMETSP0800 /ASSEMBLY_ACC=CAM_ASM_000638 /LENGTH=416 /DNA_ID=CAMNT_0006569243 /DNA_START=246 /DNA_END=1496 /DNA_ORIENTATION=-
MRCRYAAFGCRFEGTAAELHVHDQGSCPYREISSLVEQVRQMKVEHSTAIVQLQQQIAGLNELVQLERLTLRRIQERNLGSPIDIARFVYLVSCRPRHFWNTRDAWRNFHSTPEARALVHNILSLVPVTLWIVRILQHSVKFIMNVDDTNLSDKEISMHIQNMILLAFIAVLTAKCASLMLLDARSSSQWSTYQIREGINVGFRDSFALALFGLFWCLMEYDTPRKGVLVWLVVSVASVFYPSAVSVLMGENSAGKVRESLLFALKYSFLFIVFPVPCCIQSILGLRLARIVFGLPAFWSGEASECIFGLMNQRILMVSLMSFGFATKLVGEVELSVAMHRTITTMIAHVSLNVIIQSLLSLEEKFGTRWSRVVIQARQGGATNGNDNRQTWQYINLGGIAAFTLWSALLFLTIEP